MYIFSFNYLSKDNRIFFLCLLILLLAQSVRVSWLSLQSRQSIFVNRNLLFELKLDESLYKTSNGQQVKIYATDRGLRFAIKLGQEQVDWKNISGYFDPELPEKERNPGGFNQKKYLSTYNCHAIINLDSDTSQIIDVKKKQKYFDRVSLFESFQTWLQKNFDEEISNFLLSLCFGQTQDLDQSLKYDFEVLGLGHLLAVSGFHLDLFLLPLVNGLSLYKKKPSLQILTLCPLILIYNYLCDFPIGLIRASLIHIIMLVSRQYYFNLNHKNLLLLMITIFLLLNPWLIFQTSFQLSFFASLTIYNILPYISNNKFIKNKKMIQSALISLVVQITLLPFLLKNFGGWQLAVVLVSGFLNLPLTIIYVMGIFSFIMFMLFNIFGEIYLLNLFLSFLNWLITKAIDIFSKFARLDYWFILQNNERTFLTWLVFSIISLSLAVFIVKFLINIFVEKEHIFSLKKYLLSFLIFSFLLFNLFIPKQNWQIYFLDVGQGDSCLIVSPKKKSVLIDGGNRGQGYKTILPAMQYLGINKIDQAIISHSDLDHCGGIIDLIEMNRIKRVFLPEALCNETDDLIGTDYLIKLCENNQLEYELLKKYNYLDLDSINQRTKLLAPDPEIMLGQKDQNYCSLCFILSIEGLDLMFTGDLPEDVEHNLLIKGEIPKVDLLKVAHHGSKYSTSEDFLNKIDPDLAIISVGYNFYGHPAPELIDRLTQQNVKIKRTDIDGAIMLELLDGSWHIASYLNYP